MNTWSNRLILSAWIWSISHASGIDSIQAGNLEEGKAFPSFSKINFEGELPANLSGKIVLVDFWASWCRPCRKSFPVLETLHKEFRDKGVVVLGINVDMKSDLMKRFLAKNVASFPIVRDENHELVSLAGIKTMPSSFILDGTGKIRFLHEGFHGEKTAKLYRSQIESLINEK